MTLGFYEEDSFLILGWVRWWRAWQNCLNGILRQWHDVGDSAREKVLEEVRST